MRFSGGSFCGVVGGGIGVILGGIGGKFDEACTLPMVILFNRNSISLNIKLKPTRFHNPRCLTSKEIHRQPTGDS